MHWDFKLDTILLDRHEVPEEWSFGHEVKQAVHDYLSEDRTPVRVVHSMGAFSLPTTWKGILFGANALSRALELDRLCAAERQIQFQWGPFRSLVAIKKFEATPKYQFEIHYDIELTVIKDLNGAVSTLDTSVPFDIATQSFVDQSNAAVSDMQAADPKFPNLYLSNIEALLSGLDNAIPLKTASIETILALIAQVNVVIGNLTQYATPLQATAVLEADLAKLDACLRALQGFGLLNTNLQQLATGLTNASQVIETGASLFELAAQYYPNSDPATVADAIANANGLNDYFLDTKQPITLPPIFA